VGSGGLDANDIGGCSLDAQGSEDSVTTSTPVLPVASSRQSPATEGLQCPCCNAQCRVYWRAAKEMSEETALLCTVQIVLGD
jgi:hypothetical protein